jgi:hypothetical protein
MQQIQLHMDDLHKPLKVMFLGGEKGDIQEEAIDEGMLRHVALGRVPGVLHSQLLHCFIDDLLTRLYHVCTARLLTTSCKAVLFGKLFILTSNTQFSACPMKGGWHPHKLLRDYHGACSFN